MVMNRDPRCEPSAYKGYRNGNLNSLPLSVRSVRVDAGSFYRLRRLPHGCGRLSCSFTEYFLSSNRSS